MARSRAPAASAVALVLMMALVQGSMARKYIVGESTGWQVPRETNFYQDWVRSHLPFYTTDSLEFTWIEPDNVLRVNFADFTACNTNAPIQSWVASPGGLPTSMVFPLKGYSFHTLYFISGLSNNCMFGQKFSINVLQ